MIKQGNREIAAFTILYMRSPYALQMLYKCFPNNVNGSDLCCYLSRIYAMIKQGNREIAAFTILYMHYVRGMHILLFLESSRAFISINAVSSQAS